MTDPKPVHKIPGTVTHVDAETGKVIKHEGMAWNLMPPAPGKCQICAVDHEPEAPHNKDSLYYQMAFNGIVGRSPTWADAMAHCSDHVRKLWTAELKKRKAWSEPPEGEKPVKHHGVE